MEGPLLKLLIWFRSINKHALHRQFLFLEGQLKKNSPLKLLGQMNSNFVGSTYESFCLFGEEVLEEKFFRNRPTRNKKCLWWPCLLTDMN